MKILFLSSYVDPATGPSILNRLAIRLKQEGHEVRILTPRTGYDSDIITSVDHTIGVDFINRIINKIFPHYFNLIFPKLKKEIQNYSPDIINIHWTHGKTAIPIQLIPWMNRQWPVFWTIHDLWAITANSFFENANGKTFAKQPDTLVQKMYRCIQFSPQLLFRYKVWLLGSEKINTISPSNWLLRKVNESPVFRSAVNHHIPNGVDCSVFRPLDKNESKKLYGVQSGRKIVLFLSASVSDPRKGFYYFAKALEALKASNPNLVDNITTLLVGDDSHGVDNYLPTEVITLGSTGDTSKLAEYYNLADIFVSASIADNFPSTLLESSASGTPIVAFDVGGIPEIVINNETGLLSESKDVNALARNIEKLLIEDELREEFSKNCRNYVVKKFSMDKFAQSYIDIFESAKTTKN